ncbi:DJ-1 family protein [Methanoplanus sp. FWC-SCC4]|uniref:DJ-1 family protein n=1 Tax=Methanochimaera problematica TaxID=2609417 RepID=A0AA97I467_9EURY|nr:DJ-1/PfpI family protein [Methanoplanus sp. FWC-SCC4]WOF16616.1 DJ-1 family protein [Methanoplanus sp. FWC-SCC4]
MKKVKKVLIVIPPEKYENEELLNSLAIFDSAGILYEIASLEKGAINGHPVGVAEATEKLNDLHKSATKDYKGILVIGGPQSRDYLWNNGELHKIIRNFDKEGLLIGAVSNSVPVLANADILVRRETAAPDDQEIIHLLIKRDARYQNMPVVSDEHVITAKSTEYASELAKRMAEAILITPEITI